MRLTVLACLAIIGCARVAAAEQTRAVYMDPAVPLETRVRDLVLRMTLEEKAAEMMNTTPGVPT